MTTLHVVNETLTEAVSRRLRGQLAERQINQKMFGELTGWGRATVYRRLVGETPLDTSELQHIEEVTGITVAYLLTGTYSPVPTDGLLSAQGSRPIRSAKRHNKPVDEWFTPDLLRPTG